MDLIGDTRGEIWGENFQQLVPKSAEVEDEGLGPLATVVLKAYVSTNLRKENAIDPARPARRGTPLLPQTPGRPASVSLGA